MDAFVLLKLTLLIVTIINGSDAWSITPQCKRMVKEGPFNGKDSITFSEYLNIFIKAGYKLTPNQVHGTKIDFEKFDRNRDEMLDAKELVSMKEKDDLLRLFTIMDKNEDGFLSLAELMPNAKLAPCSYIFFIIT